MDADLRVYCICGPPLTGLGGGRCAGFRKVWRERSVGSGAVGTGGGKVAPHMSGHDHLSHRDGDLCLIHCRYWEIEYTD